MWSNWIAIIKYLVSFEKVHRVIRFNEKARLKNMYWYEDWSKKKSNKRLWERLFQANEYFTFWKNYGKSSKTGSY